MLKFSYSGSKYGPAMLWSSPIFKRLSRGWQLIQQTLNRLHQIKMFQLKIVMPMAFCMTIFLTYLASQEEGGVLVSALELTLVLHQLTSYNFVQLESLTFQKQTRRAT